MSDHDDFLEKVVAQGILKLQRALRRGFAGGLLYSLGDRLARILHQYPGSWRRT